MLTWMYLGENCLPYVNRHTCVSHVCAFGYLWNRKTLTKWRSTRSQTGDVSSLSIYTQCRYERILSFCAELNDPLKYRYLLFVNCVGCVSLRSVKFTDSAFLDKGIDRRHCPEVIRWIEKEVKNSENDGWRVLSGVRALSFCRWSDSWVGWQEGNRSDNAVSIIARFSF